MDNKIRSENLPSNIAQGLLALAAAGGAGVLGAIVTPFAAAPVLGLIGFGAAGPGAGTIAAGIQAGIGNVAVGSAFALAQSIAMGGAAVPAAGVLAGGGIASTISYGIAMLL